MLLLSTLYGLISSGFSLILAATLDYIIGDPLSWIHPVQIMGWIADRGSKIVINTYSKKIPRRISGIVLGLGLIILSGLSGWFLVNIGTRINFWLGTGIEIVLLGSCFALKSLRTAAELVLNFVREKDLTQARQQLSMYVGRDTENLSETEILRAVLETVAENSVDGVTAPLFYALVGFLIPGVGLVPLALAYKAASTLDSTIGYMDEPFRDLGWFSAKFEDVLTWFPCRLTVLSLALCSGKPGYVINICRRDGIKDPSPNSGWSESAYAAILGVQLGGINSYKGVIKQKPFLGSSNTPITPEAIETALNLTRNCFFIWSFFGLVLKNLFLWLP